MVSQRQRKWHTELRTDIAMLIHNNDKQVDLVEVVCSPTSRLTQTAQGATLKAEQWTKDDFDLSNHPAANKPWKD